MIRMIGNWLKQRRERTERRQRFMRSVDRLAETYAAALVAVRKRQEELYEFQIVLTKAVVVSAGDAHKLAIQLAEAEPHLRDEIIALAQQKLAENEAKRKFVLDWIARMESQSDERKCQIEQLEKDLEN